ncbi:MAG TPA: M14 metallopeptidase family protein [Gemmatimonadaceae bacterium]
MRRLAAVIGVTRRTITAMMVGAFVAALGQGNAQSTVLAPESVFGHAVGADSQLFAYDQSIEYFRRLAATSPYVRLIEVGKTSFGKTWTVALISSPANLSRLDEVRRINQRLAQPDGLSDTDARALAGTGIPLVDISGGLHASEIAGSQHTPQLAYELVSRAAEPDTREILDNTILFLWPSINPDGQDIVVNWCREQLAGRNPAPMELYQKYIGHDNNRDSYMLNVVESRVIARTWREWEPQIIYVHHQSSPFPTRIWIPPFADPIGLYAPPIMSRTVNTIGMRIAQELDQAGKPGAVHMLATFDSYYPGYIDYMPMYQHIAAWWTETQGGNCGIPRTSTVDQLPAAYRALLPASMYASPWAEGRWTLRDQVDYMVTASVATLRYAARFREEVLYNRYVSGRAAIAARRAAAPYAWIIPQQQRDPVAPVELLRRIAFLGVRVMQLGREAAYEGTSYPAGTWVIPMDQAFAPLVRELMEPQKYPDMGDDLPYDAAGWTLPYQMNVTAIEANAPLPVEFRAALTTVQGNAEPWDASDQYPFTTNAVAAGIVPLTPAIAGSGSTLYVDPAQNNAFRLINRALAQGATVRYMSAGAGGPRYLISGTNAPRLDALARDLWVSGERRNPPRNAAFPTVPSRVALYKASPGNMDQGWTEWLLDSYGFTYTRIGPGDLRDGQLGERFDVILMASQSLTSAGRGGRGGAGGGGAPGGRGGGMPPAQRADDSARVAAIDAFVRGGGTVVAWNQGTTSLIPALQLPVRNVMAGVSRQEYFTGISIMRAIVDTLHPVMAGMPAEADVVVSGSPVFATMDGFDGSVLAKYPAEGVLLRSGFLKGEQRMQGYAAALDVKHGNGHIVLIAFQPQWRGQPHGTFRVVFNSAFYGRAVSASAAGTPGFWTPPS